MNIAQANTEPFYRFHRFHEDFNRNTKVAFGALESLRRSSSQDQATQAPLTKLPTGEEPWGVETKWRSLSTIILKSNQFLSQMGLVRVASAFEDFLINTKAEYDRHTSIAGRAPAAALDVTEEQDTGEQLSRLCKQLHWDITPIAYLLPVLQYFTIASNCIVHRSGRASEALVALANSPDFLRCLSHWPSDNGKPLPALPTAELSRDISFLPRHAILASDVCYRAAKHLNRTLCQILSQEGIVYMAAYHALLADDRVPTRAWRSPVHIVNAALGDRYHIPDLDPFETATILKQTGKWSQCVKKYNALYPGGRPAVRNN
jgi:hypothetical protein